MLMPVLLACCTCSVLLTQGEANKMINCNKRLLETSECGAAVSYRAYIKLKLDYVRDAASVVIVNTQLWLLLKTISRCNVSKHITTSNTNS
jgi:hypothetical protein